MTAKKLTLQQAFALLNKIGVSAEHVASEAESDMNPKVDDATFKPTTEDELILMVDANRKPIISQQVLQDANATIYDTVTKKVYTGLRKQYIEEGVPAAELEGKNEKEMAKIARAHFSKNSNLDADAINVKMQELIDNKNAEAKKINDDWAAKYGELETKHTRKETLDALKGKYKTAKGIKIGANVDLLAGDFLKDVEANAIVKLGANGDIELYDKKNPTQRLLNTAGTGFANIEDGMKSFHDPRGQWDEDTRNISAADQMKQRSVTQQDQFQKDGTVLSPREANMNNINNWLTAAEA